MAKRKTKKQEIVDLKPKAEKITEQQLQRVQAIVGSLNNVHVEIGRTESRKHMLLHNIDNLNNDLDELKKEFETQYGTTDINIQTGDIKYTENGEINKKD